MCTSYFAAIQNKKKQVRPTDLAPVLTRLDRDTGEIFEGFAWWTLVPGWAKDRSRSKSNFNARIETIGEKPSFRDAFQQRRCLVPALAFHEWTGSKGNKTMHTIEPEVQGQPEPVTFMMAGLYEPWNDIALGEAPFLNRQLQPVQDNTETGTGKPIGTYAIVTTEANQQMSAIHDRQPVMLNREQQDAWLNHDIRHDEVIAIVKEQHQTLTITPPLLYM